ncbi:MAG: cyclic nucleotide-binding domain-containing protein [Sulfitobacter sp.]
MSDVYNYLTSAATFVHLAVLCYILGLLTRNELVLRGFILLGTGFYILYYYYIADSPLWEAIGASVLIGAANMPVIWRIFRERSTFGMSEEMLTLYRAFPNFNPGQFRTIMAKAEIVHDSPRLTLLQQDVAPDKMYLTITDGFELERDTQNAELGPGNFLGEISFLLGGPATATVVAREGTSYVSWDTGQLQYMMANSPAMANAVSVLLNKDIARKLAVSFPSQPSPLPNNVT